MHSVLVVPARNEAATIGEVLTDLGAELARTTTAHIVVVDDHSDDATPSAARAAGAEVLSLSQTRGLAAAFRAGMKRALQLAPDVIVHADADGQHTALAVRRILETYVRCGGLVLGNRLHRQPEGMTDIKYWWNLYLSELISHLAGFEISDSQTGLRAFSPEIAALQIDSDHTYTQEQILLAAWNDYLITDVEIPYPPRKVGESRLITSPFLYLERVAHDLDRLFRSRGIQLDSTYVRHSLLER